MRPKIIQKKKLELLQYVSPEIRICIICGYDKIDSFEFGVSCEECGALFGRK